MEIYSDYDPFARVYNKHWGTNFIPLVLPILNNYVLSNIPENARILDLCCGTGQLAGLLHDRGYNVTGLDGSTEMLRYARENAPGVEFVLADARAFNHTEKFDAVISVFDSLNHIMSLDGLTDAFISVYNVLYEGGIFFFDLNMDAGYKKDWHDEFNIVEEDMVCIIRSDFSPYDSTASFNTTVFIKNKEWKRSDFTIMQQCYPAVDVVSALEKAGFAEISACDYNVGKGLTELTPDSGRAFFICEKPQG